MSNKNTSNSSDSTLLLSFSKYHGLGNDFIIVDNRNRILDPKHVKHLCDRHRGVGADGVMLVENDDSTDSTASNADLTHLPADIRYRIYNSDGSEA
jgi:diaminopimelate epimerase